MKKTTMRLFALAMLMMISMGAWADVDIQIAYGGFFRGGTITAKQDEAKDGKVTVSLTVTPKKGYTISKKDIIVVTTYDLPSSDEISSSRADVPKISDPIDLGDDPKDLSAERTYKVTIDENFGLWVQKATFISGRKGEGDVEVTYHIINLGRMNNDGTLGSDRTEALKFTIADNELGVPAKYKSPLATNWKYYKADEVSYNSETKVCTFNSEPTLSEGNTLSESTDIYVTYELNKDAFGTVGLKDGGIYNIKQGSLYMYQSMYQNVNNLNTYFKSTDDPTESIYLWKFNIKDPYQVTIQTKSTSYDNYYLAGEDNNFNNIRLKSSLAIAKSTKVWTFGLLPGGTDGTYRLVVADGYVPTANIQTLDAFNHGYLNNADKARYQRYQGSTYKNCDLTFPPLKRSYTFHMIDRSQRHAIQHTVDEQEVGKLSDYTDIPSAIRSPYLEGETMTFYSFTGDYSSEKITDANLVTEMPLTDADIYVTYTNTHLSDKFLHLRGARALNVKIGGQYIYDESGLKSESTDANKSQSNHLWYFTGEDPYAVHIRNAGTNNFLGYTPPSTLLVEANPANKNFILLSGGAEGDNSTYDQMELMAANGDDTYYRVGFSDGLNISTTTTGVASVQVVTYPVDVSSQYYLIDRAGKLIAGPLPSSSSELALPSEWVSPLVSKYHYYKAATENSGIYIVDAADEISNPIESESGNIYVTYDVSDVIDITGGKTYLLKFSNGEVFNQEDGKDGIITTPTKAIYPYNNGDFHLYVYGQNQWDTQLANGASTRSRWLWKIVSTGENADPYHVVIKSNQNQSVKDKKDGVDYNFPGNTYLRTYKPAGYGLVVTGVAYENEEYRTDYPGKMPTSMVNGQPTEYMILGTSLSEMTLKTFNAVDDGDDDPTNDVRQIVNCFEQYWKNNPTARDILNAADKGVGSQSVDYELSDPQKALLTAKGWHTYQAWAYSAPWNDESTGGKTLANGNHWFQTISMGDGKFTLEAVDLQPQVILLDQHGWEIMRVPMTETEILRKYDSPMVDEYHWYPTAVKTTGYHKYTISDPAPLIDIYTFGDDPATSEHKDVWYVGVSVSYSSNSLAETPETNLSGYSDQDNKYKTDFYVTYTVKSEYANAYTGAASADATIPSAYHLKQGGKYAKVDGTTLTNAEAPADMENVPNNMLWYVKPNFDIDKEMGYKYAGETGAQGNALSKSATDAANYSEGRNGFDPYNVQIQSKAQSLYYFTANTSGSKLEGGAWQGSSNQVSLKNLNVKQTATGYDQTTLNITNATFMVVGDANGNMRLMPRFDQQKVMQGFATFEVQAVAQPANDNGTHVQSLYLGRISSAKEISSSADITKMNGHYLLAENFTFDSNFESLENFTGIIDGQLHVIRGTLSKPLIKTANGAIIRNVIFENVDVSSSVTFGEEDKTAIGAIACVAKGNTRIYNCGILATGSTVKTNDDGYTVITSCSSSVGGSADYVGGLVGFLDGEARVINCFSYANITSGTNVGGIVGWNNYATTSEEGKQKTMVMNCMFYGDITGTGYTSKAPIYNGINIVNKDANGVGNYNYFWGDASYVQPEGVTYNCALMAETRYLQRFEFFRHLLNSHRELAGWWATGTYSKDEMAKWVLEPSQIGTSTPYPILKPSGYYPSVVNLDADNAEEFSNNADIKKTQRNQGRKFGTLAVTINMGSGGAVYAKPTGAEITTSSLSLPIVDKDPDHFNFNYYKVQLPYYNDVGTKNYNGNRVVTGWKITSITGGTAGSYSTGEDVTYTDGVLTATPYNFADRNCTNKDLYSVSKRVFNQGAYWDVPYGVTAITIEPYWAKCTYLADAYADVVYNQAMTSPTNVPNVGGGQIYTDGNSYPIAGESQKVFTTKANATSTSNSGLFQGVTGKPKDQTVYDYAVVLVGNYHHYNNMEASMDKPYTVTSIDLDGDNEPDYSYILRFDSRKKVHPVRVDFINIPGLGMAQKSYGGTGTYNFGIMQPKGWFESTNTSLFRETQFEYDSSERIAAPYILQGGVMEQWVNGQSAGHANKTTYFHVGGNVWFKEFHRGTHQDNNYDANHSPVSVTGGDFDQFHLTGLYLANATIRDDNAECYITGGRFGVVAGTGMDGLGTTDGKGNITWIIDNADIEEFYAGSFNADKPAIGNLHTIVNGGHIDLFCGGPKFGDMSANKTVTTTATGCTFGTFFGAGYGGNSYSRQAPRNHNNIVNFPHNDSQAGNDDSWNAWLGRFYKQEYNSEYGGVSTQFNYQFLPMSGNADNCARIFVEYVKFSLAKTRNVTSTLTGCTITGNFYGGGSLGSVEGDVTSTLTDCEVSGSVFGAGFSASLPTVEVDAIGFETEPLYYTELGTYRTGVKYHEDPDYVHPEGDKYKPKTYTWEQGNSIGIDKNKSILYTTEDLTSLGVVTGLATLNINGSTTVAGNVYGGGEESNVSGNTNVNICVVKNGDDEYVAESGTVTIAGNVYGGGKGKIEEKDHGSFECAKAMVGIDGAGADADNYPNYSDGNTHVRIGNGTVGTLDGNNKLVAGTGNVYGGGQIGRVEQNTEVTIGFGTSSPVIEGSVFGAGAGVKTHGYAALVRGNSTVTVQGKAWVKKSVYGGGEIASVGRYIVDETSGLPTIPNGGGICYVNIQGSAEIGPDNMQMTAEGGPDDAGHVFGAGKGVLPYEGYEDNEEPQHMDGHKDDNDKWVDDPKSYTAYGSLGDNEDANYSKFLHTLALSSETYVTIDGNAFIKGSVYGGGENGFVQTDTHVKIAGGQIGCGKNTTERYSDDVWKPGYVPTTDLECASWTFGDGKPYDKYAGAAGYDAKEGALVATDGHTFYGNVFAGGSGYYPYRPGKWFQSAGRVNGNTNLTITGGHILTNVYGGNEMTDVVGSCTINMSDGTVGVPRTYEQMRAHPVTCYIFGAGKGDARVFFNTWTNVASTQVNISGSARIYGSTFGGGEDGHVLGDAETNINTGSDVPVGTGESASTLRYPYIGTTGTSAVDGNIFGGGRGYSENALTAGVVCGNVRVNIHDGTILGSIFGGGRLASVGTHLAAAGTDYYGTMIPDGKQQVIGGEDVEDSGMTHGHVTITIDGGSIGAVDNTGKLVNSNYSIGDVYGGSKGTATNKQFGLAKSTNVTISEANAKIPTRINRSVFGGGEAGNVQEEVSVTLNGGIVGEDLYGGGALADTNIGNWNATLNEGAGGFAEGIVGEDGKTKYKTEVNLLGGTIKGDAFGGGLGQKTGFNGGTSNIEATTYGDITVTLGKEDKSSATAFNTTYENTDEKDENNQFIKVVKSGRLFGTNNLNGSPKGNVMVNVYCTQNKLMTTIAEKFIREKDSDIEKEENENTEDYVTRLKGILTGKIALAEALNISVSSENKALCTDDNAEALALKTAITSITTSIDGKTTEEINGVRYDMAAVYGGGNLADYTTAGKKASVIIHTCDVSVQDVYGGGNAASVPETDVLVKGAYEIEHVFGGGNGKDKFKKGTTWMDNDGADVLGDANTLMIGGYIHEAYGGSNEKGKIHGSVHINSNAKDPACDCVLELESFYTAGNNADVDGDAIAVVDCMPDKVTPEIYGGAKNANVKGNVELTIRGGTFGKVFGGNNQSGAIFGHIILNIEETNPDCSPIIIDELYGCGNMAAYSVYGYYQDGTDENGYPKYVPRTSANDHVPVTFEGKPHTNPNAVANKYQYDDPVVNIISCTRIGKVFGGGLGLGAVVYGNPTVNINQMKGVWAGKTYGTGDDALVIDDDLGKIGDVFGGGNEAEVKGNTTVNIGTATTVQHHLSYNKDTGVYTMSEDKVVLGANIIGNVYGGGNKANVTGSTKVNIGQGNSSTSPARSSEPPSESQPVTP